jgi:Raf kinase inhibitor-like YbhB/YbcL family protein
MSRALTSLVLLVCVAGCGAGATMDGTGDFDFASGGDLGTSGGGHDGGGGGDDAGSPEPGDKLELRLLGLDETMRIYRAPVFTAAMSNPMNQSPAMSWTGIPAGTKSLAISMIDTNAVPVRDQPVVPGSAEKVHFVYWDIPVSASPLRANLPRMATIGDPAGMKASQTFQGFGWFGPGANDVHVYVVTLWPLDVAQLKEVKPGARQQDAYDALAKHVIGTPTPVIAVGKQGGL